MNLDYIPKDYNGIQVVDSISALVNARFGPANVILHPRRLTGDFNALAQVFHEAQEKNSDLLPREFLQKLAADQASPALAQAAHTVLADMDMVEQAGAYSSLRALKVNNQFYSEGHYHFHEDNVGTDPKQTHRGLIMCCYTEPVTEGLRNDDIVAHIQPIFYKAKEGATIIKFHPGDLWRQAPTATPDGPPVPPYVHRAPVEAPNGAIRLLLVGI